MTARELKACLRKLSACDEARKWADGKDLQAAWDTCDRVYWMLWLCGRMADQPGWPTRQQIVLVACSCAETALQYVKEGEDRPRIAIETARKWARGEASRDEVLAAARAADAAYAADDDAADAAYAAAAYAADADADAADRSTTSLANDASAARAKALAALANVVRREVPAPFVAPVKIGGAA